MRNSRIKFEIACNYYGWCDMNIVDLFSGAGGLTFGFQYRVKKDRFVRNRQNNILFANEYDAQAFRENFPDIPLICDDIANVTLELITQLNINIENIDLVIGGPPCQSYSTVGKRQYDNRAKLYKEYIRLLGILMPKMFIFENVTGLLSMKNDNHEPVLSDIKRMFADIYGNKFLSYEIKQEVLNAKNYGVPQSRDRVFLVGIRSDLDSSCWSFPKQKYGDKPYQLPLLTVEDAISDLPNLNEGETIDMYVLPPQNAYQELMRNGSVVLSDHFIGTYGDKIKTVIKNVIQGEGKRYFNNLVDEGIVDRKYYLTSGYNNTYGRLWWNRPSTTVTNSFGTPSSLRCIHPLQDRALSTREGARLQSFPDWFKFCGNKYEKNSQIGNAVPPLLAIELAKQVKKCFKRWENRQ